VLTVDGRWGIGLGLLLLGERLLGLKLLSLTESLLRLAEIHIYESRLSILRWSGVRC
jgi:hypothetical protein